MKNISIIILLTILIFLFLEGISRIYIYSTYGNFNAGIKERSVNLAYKPFIMWGPNFDKESEKFLNSRKISEKDFVILILGGSTAGEFTGNTRGKNSLQETFTQLLSDDNSKLHIFNAAVGGFNIRQQISAMMLTVEKINPDLILVVDGANDIQHSLRTGVMPGTTFVDNTYKFILNRPYLGPLALILQKSQFINGISRYLNRNAILNKTKDNELNLSRTIEYYLHSRNFINKYAKGAGIKIVFMLQPHVVFSQNPDDNKAKERFSYRSDIVKDAFTKISNSDYSENLCFVDSNKNIEALNLSLEFIDDVHFKNKKGYQYMSEMLLKTYLSCYQ